MAIHISTVRAVRPQPPRPSAHRYSVAQLDFVLSEWASDLQEVADHIRFGKQTAADLRELDNLAHCLNMLAVDVDDSKPRPAGAPPLPRC